MHIPADDRSRDAAVKYVDERAIAICVDVRKSEVELIAAQL